MRALTLLALFGLACSTTGYVVTVEATVHDQLGPTLSGLESCAQDNAFDVVAKHEERPDGVRSSYSKWISSRPHDVISFDVWADFLNQTPARVRIYVQDRWHGMEPATKAEIDRVSDQVFAMLRERFGKDVSIQRNATAPPLFY